MNPRIPLMTVCPPPWSAEPGFRQSCSCLRQLRFCLCDAINCCSAHCLAGPAGFILPAVSTLSSQFAGMVCSLADGAASAESCAAIPGIQAATILREDRSIIDSRIFLNPSRLRQIVNSPATGFIPVVLGVLHYVVFRFRFAAGRKRQYVEQQQHARQRQKPPLLAVIVLPHFHV